MAYTPFLRDYSRVSKDQHIKYNMVGTPDWLSDRVISNIPIDPQATYLDPCVGGGAFIKALVKAGVREDQIYANDIFPENVTYCKSIFSRINYEVGDLLDLSGSYDYVVASPPFCRKLPQMVTHCVSLASRQCVFMAKFFHGSPRYNKVEGLISGVVENDFNELVKTVISYQPVFEVPWFYVVDKSNPVGLDTVLYAWILRNGLEDYLTLDSSESVPNNLVPYSGQRYVLPINPTWFLRYVYFNFKVSDLKDISILGKLNLKRDKNSVLVYQSQVAFDNAIEHYSSTTVKKMLACGSSFGWRHLKLV